MPLQIPFAYTVQFLVANHDLNHDCRHSGPQMEVGPLTEVSTLYVSTGGDPLEYSIWDIGPKKIARSYRSVRSRHNFQRAIRSSFQLGHHKVEFSDRLIECFVFQDVSS